MASFPVDRSPFGVHDLAGSVSEATLSSYGLVPDVRAFCGGSFLDSEQARFTTLSVRGEQNRPVDDAGFRLVAHRFPAWSREATEAPSRFFDTFDSPEVAGDPGGWIGWDGNLLDQSPVRGQGGSFQRSGGYLVIRSTEGNFSRRYNVYHRIALGRGGFRVRARVHLRWSRPRAGEPGGSHGRGVLLRLTDESLDHHGSFCGLFMTAEGGVHIRAGEKTETRPRTGLDPRSATELELVVREGRAWPAGDPRPAAALLDVPMIESGKSPCFVGLTADNYLGVTVFVDEVLVEGL